VFNRDYDLSGDKPWECLDYGGAAGKPIWSESADGRRHICASVNTCFHGESLVPVHDTDRKHAATGVDFVGAAGFPSLQHRGWNFAINLDRSSTVDGGPHRSGKKQTPRAPSLTSSTGKFIREDRGRRTYEGAPMFKSEFGALLRGQEAWATWTRGGYETPPLCKHAAGVPSFALGKAALKASGLSGAVVPDGFMHTRELLSDGQVSTRNFSGYDSGRSTPRSASPGRRTRSAPPGSLCGSSLLA